MPLKLTKEDKTMMEKQRVTDAQLIKLYVGGDKGAISTLIEQNTKRVKDYIRMMVHDADIADDIFQETFIKVVAKIDGGKYVDNGRFLSWVLRIAHNQTIDYFRKNKNRSNISESDARFEVLNTQHFSDPNIEQKLISDQTEQDIKAMIAGLSDEQKRAIEMRYFEGYSFKDIAEATGVSVNTALGRVRYALINLRKMSGNLLS